MNEEKLKNQEILEQLEKLVILMRAARPVAQSEYARRCAIAITEAEKLYAFFKVWIRDFSNE